MSSISQLSSRSRIFISFVSYLSPLTGKSMIELNQSMKVTLVIIWLEECIDSILTLLGVRCSTGLGPNLRFRKVISLHRYCITISMLDWFVCDNHTSLCPRPWKEKSCKPSIEVRCNCSWLPQVHNIWWKSQQTTTNQFLKIRSYLTTLVSKQRRNPSAY